MDQSKIQRIAVLCLPGIGDALMATPLIALLDNHFPHARIEVICMFGGVEYVMQQNPHVDAVHKVSLYGGNAKKGLGQLLALRRNKYDLSILAFPAYRAEYQIVHWLIGARKRIGHRFQNGYLRELQFLNTDRVLVNEAEHNLENNLNLLQALGINWRDELDPKTIKYDLNLKPEDEVFGKEFVKKLNWKPSDVIGIHPGSTNSPAAIVRRWPVERFASVATSLIKQGKKILVFVGPDELEVGTELMNKMNDSEHCELVSNVQFGQSLGVVKQLSLLLCNDNGFGHLANGLNVPVVTLWASTEDRWSRPYNSSLVTIVRPTNFKPWYRYDLKRAVPEGATGGMELITVEAVEQAISERLK